MQEKFDKASEIERKYLQKIPGITNFIPSDNSDFHDGIIYTKNNTVIAEAKVRTFGVNKFKTAIIEKSKFDNLISTKKYLGLDVYYFAYYPEDKICYVFDMYNTKHKVTFDMMLPKTTMGHTYLVPTDVIEYDFNDAIGKYKLKEIFE
jgi:hypothetical protein